MRPQSWVEAVEKVLIMASGASQALGWVAPPLTRTVDVAPVANDGVGSFYGVSGTACFNAAETPLVFG